MAHDPETPSDSGDAPHASSAVRPRFDSCADLRAFLARLDGERPTPPSTTGNWSAAQILFHLAAAFEASCELPPARAGSPQPSRLRKLPLRFFALRGKFPKGMAIPAAVSDRLTPPAAEDLDFREQLLRLDRAIERFEPKRGEPMPAHPVLGVLSYDEWNTFHLRHCEMHLSYIASDITP